MVIRKMGFCFRPSSTPPPGPVSFVRHFSYKDIKKAMDGFCRIIYSDSDGAAYGATFHDVGVTLVKEVKAFVFYREVQLLGRLHHRHLLSLKGFSMGRSCFLRLLEYLLHFNDPPIYSVSISSSGIQLDENFVAKLSRVSVLGSSRCTDGTNNSSSSKDGMDTARNDVMFQLGVVILELITGQSSEQGRSDLIEWVQQNHTGSSMHKLFDPDLRNDYNLNELKDLLNVARLCIKFRDKPASSSAARVLRNLQKKNNGPVH